MNNACYDVIVIGTGPSSMNASILLLDQGLDVLIFDTDQSQSNKSWIRNLISLKYILIKLNTTPIKLF